MTNKTSLIIGLLSLLYGFVNAIALSCELRQTTNRVITFHCFPLMHFFFLAQT